MFSRTLSLVVSLLVALMAVEPTAAADIDAADALPTVAIEGRGMVCVMADGITVRPGSEADAGCPSGEELCDVCGLGVFGEKTDDYCSHPDRGSEGKSAEKVGFGRGKGTCANGDTTPVFLCCCEDRAVGSLRWILDYSDPLLTPAPWAAADVPPRVALYR